MKNIPTTSKIDNIKQPTLNLLVQISFILIASYFVGITISLFYNDFISTFIASLVPVVSISALIERKKYKDNNRKNKRNEYVKNKDIYGIRNISLCSTKYIIFSYVMSTVIIFTIDVNLNILGYGGIQRIASPTEGVLWFLTVMLSFIIIGSVFKSLRKSGVIIKEEFDLYFMVFIKNGKIMEKEHGEYFIIISGETRTELDNNNLKITYQQGTEKAIPDASEIPADIISVNEKERIITLKNIENLEDLKNKIDKIIIAKKI